MLARPYPERPSATTVVGGVCAVHEGRIRLRGERMLELNRNSRIRRRMKDTQTKERFMSCGVNGPAGKDRR